jgi:hypothetical protein
VPGVDSLQLLKQVIEPGHVLVDPAIIAGLGGTKTYADAVVSEPILLESEDLRDLRPPEPI